VDSPLEEAVRSEPVSETPNSLLAGKIQGILPPGASDGGCLLKIEQPCQCFTAQFPTNPNREFILA
jgi:hypothetical protein